jgi:hypothetical protein
LILATACFSGFVIGNNNKLRVYDVNAQVWANEFPAAGVFANNVIHIFANDQFLFASLARP